MIASSSSSSQSFFLPRGRILAGPRGAPAAADAGLGGLSVELLQDLAAAAEQAGRGQQQQRRGEEQEDPKAGKDADDLRAVEEDGGARVAQLPLARAGVVVAQEEVVLE